MKINQSMIIGHSMMDFTRRFKAFLKAQLAHCDINFNEAITLMAICGGSRDGPVASPSEGGSSIPEAMPLCGNSAEQLLEVVTCDKSVMTRTLQSLEKKSLVIREPNPQDGRSFIFQLTEEGTTMTDFVIDAIRKWSDEIFTDITQEETALLISLLKKM